MHIITVISIQNIVPGKTFHLSIPLSKPKPFHKAQMIQKIPMLTVDVSQSSFHLCKLKPVPSIPLQLQQSQLSHPKPSSNPIHPQIPITTTCIHHNWRCLIDAYSTIPTPAIPFKLIAIITFIIRNLPLALEVLLVQDSLGSRSIAVGSTIIANQKYALASQVNSNDKKKFKHMLRMHRHIRVENRPHCHRAYL